MLHSVDTDIYSVSPSTLRVAYLCVWKEELYIKRLQSEITNCVWDGSDLYYHLITNFCGCKERLVGDIIFSFSNQLEVGFGFKGRDSGCFGRLKEAFLWGWECFWRRDTFADGWLDQAGQLSLLCYCHLLWEARYLAIALCVGASWVEKRLIRRKELLAKRVATTLEASSWHFTFLDRSFNWVVSVVGRLLYGVV